jgi:hypothetical protein
MVGTMIAVVTIGVTTAICEKLFFENNEAGKIVIGTVGIVASSILLMKCVLKVYKEMKLLGL